MQRERDSEPLSERTGRLAQTAGSSRSSRRRVWSSAIETTCATCTCSTVKPGNLTLESLGHLGQPADGDSREVDISADGRFVVLAAEAGNLTNAPFAPGTSHIFLRDRIDGTTRLLTVSARAIRRTVRVAARPSTPLARR